MNQNELALRVQTALIGEVPSTLRFVYAHIENDTLYYRAVFADDATEDHLECASVVLTEISAGLPPSFRLEESIERNSASPWKMDTGAYILYLRYGELENT